MCKVFGESLLYLFYGRASYRDPSNDKPQQGPALLPICLLFRPGTLSQMIKRIYPFDTGASQKELYEPHVQAKDALQKYAVSAAIESARRLVDCFFGTNENYFTGIAKNKLSIASVETEAQALYRLIKKGGDQTCDDRRSAIEVQLAEKADLRQSLLAVVLPTYFLDDQDLRRTLLDDWRAQPLGYPADVGMRPSEFHGVIRLKIREYYESWGFI
jgi:hypothetical protein